MQSFDFIFIQITNSFFKVKRDPNKAFYREPADAEAVRESGDVMKDVISEELKPANTDEENALKSWVDAGQDRELNPDFMNASEAKDLALASLWSTKEVATTIKNAAALGKFSIRYSALANNVIYALQQAGYTVTLVNGELEEEGDINISWENLGEEKGK